MFQESLYLFFDGLMHCIDIKSAVDDKETLWVLFRQLVVCLFYLSVEREILFFESIH